VEFRGWANSEEQSCFNSIGCCMSSRDNSIFIHKAYLFELLISPISRFLFAKNII